MLAGISYLQPVLPSVPLQSGSGVLHRSVDVRKAPEFLVVAAEDIVVLASFLDAHAIVCKRLRVVEVEGEQQPSPFIDYHFVYLVFQRYVGLARVWLVSFIGRGIGRVILYWRGG